MASKDDQAAEAAETLPMGPMRPSVCQEVAEREAWSGVWTTDRESELKAQFPHGVHLEQ